MKYKISDTPLKLKEYGRNIQSMVEYIKGIEDRDRRTKLAHEIISIMSNLQPQIKEYPDYKQKLWDHLFLIADFDLDIDTPFPKPTREMVEPSASERMSYYEGKPRYRQYGFNVELMVKEATQLEDPEARKQYTNLIANTMNQFLWNMDRGSRPENVIADQINEISGGKLAVKAEDIRLHKITTSKSQNQHKSHSHSSTHKRKKKKKRHNY